MGIRVEEEFVEMSLDEQVRSFVSVEASRF